MTPEQIKAAVSEALDERGIKQHEDHHDFIQEMIAKSERRQALWQRFRLSLVGAVATALVGLLALFGKWIVENSPVVWWHS